MDLKNKKKKLKELVSNLLVWTMVIGISFFSLGLGCKQAAPASVDEIVIWGVFDDPAIINNLLEQYRKDNRQVGNITYKKFDYGVYEQELIKALAAGKGPDVFAVHHTWLAKHKDLMMGAEEARKAYNDAVNAMGGCSKPPLANDAIITERQLQESFVDVVANDFTSNGEVYGIPLTVDTLALYYNDDLFAAAGITNPPSTWEQFQSIATALTRKDEFNNIIQSGAALGTANNVNRASDIWTMMAMQAGATMVDKNTRISRLNESIRDLKTGQFFSPEEKALNFYTSFAKGSNPNYMWNPTLHNSIDNFQEGKSAMLINYSYAYQNIKNKAPKLNVKVAPIPQWEGGSKLTYSDYWGYAVSRNLTKKNKPFESWRLLAYLGKKEQEEQYTSATKQPASRRDVLQSQESDPVLGVFAEQALLAKDWFQPDKDALDKTINENIEDTALNKKSAKDAVKAIDARLTVLLKDLKQ